MKNKSVYFDYAASTPLDPRVLRTMLPYFKMEYCGNTASLHAYGQKASRVVEDSRIALAKILNANKDEIIFTASATESNNLVLKGIAFANKAKGKHIIVSSIEHDCVLNSTKWLRSQGFEITYLPVNNYGLIDLKVLKASIRPDTILVSVIHANNEIGTIQDLKEIGKICKSKSVYFHTDASQSFAKVPLDVKEMNIDLLTASSHKIYGPKGVALLYIKSGVNIEPLLHGGGHEYGLRSSTVNTPLIVGFAKAANLCIEEIKEETARLTALRDRLISGILKSVEGSYLNGHLTRRLPNNINISFSKVEGESLLLQLDFAGIACSTGSACSSNSLEPSHVLLATGLKPHKIHGTLRFSLGRWTTEEEVDYLLEKLPQVVNKFRILSPFKL
jgi:cysteine desulfurase